MRNNTVNLSQALNNIKVYTILLVIIGHILAIYTPTSSFPLDGSKLTGILYNIIYSFHMPLFISVSGAVYAICRSKNKYSTWTLLIKEKSKRILLPYFTFAILILFPSLKLLDITDINIGEYIINIIIGKNHLKHLWYLYVLFEMFIITYALEKIINSVHTYILLTTLLIISVITYNTNIISIFQINMLLRYYLYFIIGYLIARGNIRIRCHSIIEISLIILGVVGVWIMYQLPSILFSLVSTFTAISFITAAYSICQKYKMGAGTKVYELIKKDGMGIYLFHIIIIYTFYYFDLFASYGIYVQILSATITSLVCSIALTRIVRILHLKFLIGELK